MGRLAAVLVRETGEGILADSDVLAQRIRENQTQSRRESAGPYRRFQDGTPKSNSRRHEESNVDRLVLLSEEGDVRIRR